MIEENFVSHKHFYINFYVLIDKISNNYGFKKRKKTKILLQVWKNNWVYVSTLNKKKEMS